MTRIWVLLTIALSAASGCSHEPRLVTRTYELPAGETSWRAVSLALDDEWQRNNVLSYAERHGDTAVVSTTTRGHRKVDDALAVRR